MNPFAVPITLGGVLLTLSALAGLALLGVGTLALFAGGMSSAPAEGERVSRQGCHMVIVAALVLVGSLWALFK